MAIWVALIRGINVGGNNIIPMRALAETFERAGMRDVKTYIQSGNVLFRSDVSNARTLEKRLEKAIDEAHGCNVKVVVRSRAELDALVKNLPPDWKKPSAKKRYYVLFLRHDVDSKDALDHVKAKDGVEEIVYRPGVLLWSALLAKITRSSISKLTQTPLYKDVTIRNLNTTLKLHALAKALEG